MTNHRRRLAFGAICAGALWLSSAPACALSVTVGGPTGSLGPIAVPLPVSASISNGGTGGADVGVAAPGGATIHLQAGPSGVQANATTAVTPPVDVRVAPPDLPGRS